MTASTDTRQPRRQRALDALLAAARRDGVDTADPQVEEVLRPALLTVATLTDYALWPLSTGSQHAELGAARGSRLAAIAAAALLDVTEVELPAVLTTAQAERLGLPPRCQAMVDVVPYEDGAPGTYRCPALATVVAETHDERLGHPEEGHYCRRHVPAALTTRPLEVPQ